MNQNQTITLNLTVDQVNLVIGALAKAPYEQVADVITNIRTQAIPQVEPTPAPQEPQEQLQ
jgi:hypothetical protein